MEMAEVRFGRHRFDPLSGRLWSGRREIRLTPRAAAVLAALIARAGQPVSRDELFRTVWRDVVVSDAALTACIQELRGALDDDARRPHFIETRHRRGYRFVASVAPPATGTAPDSPPLSARGLVVGRDRELRELRAHLACAVRGERRIVFVTGEPGIGKTTTVHAFLAEAARTGPLRIGQGRCVELHGPGEAYLPLLEAMTRLLRAPGGQRLTRLFRQHAPSWLAEMPSIVGSAELLALRQRTSGVTRARMLRELAEVVEVMAEEGPLVLWLEDLHWSDPSTVDWVGYVARRPGPAHVLLLASYRPGEAPSRALEAITDELIVHGHAHEMAIGPLDEREVGDYLGRRVPDAAGVTALAPTLHRRTGGHPLFLSSIVDDLIRHGVASTPDLVALDIPADLRRLIGHALDRVTTEQRGLLEAASAAGVDFSAAVVAATTGLPLDDAEQTCAELARRGSFLTAVGADAWPDQTVAGRYAFRHALHQDVIYERIATGRRMELHRRIGERLEAGFGERAGEIAGLLAGHFARGRDAHRAIRYLRRAAEVAMQRGATREAVEHLGAALELLATEPETAERAAAEVGLQIALGGPLMALHGRGAPEVERAYTRAQELSELIGDPSRLFAALWGLFLFRRSRGEIDVAHGLGLRLLVLAEGIGETGFLIEAHHALWATLFARGELAAACEHAMRALALYDRDRHADLAPIYGHHDPAVCASGHAAWALELSGDPDRASRHIGQALALGRAIGQPFSEAHALLSAARLYQFRGDWRTTREHAEAAAALARESGFAQLEAWATTLRGWALALAGDTDQGVETARAGVATLRTLGSQDFSTYFRGVLAETLVVAGDCVSALDVVDEALRAVESTGERFYAAELHRLRGELLRAVGRDAATIADCFEAARAVAGRQGARTLEQRAHRSLTSARHRG
jgi:predicted ATPase/DNA-binding winged helix-turn-helix (wHTH) protein